MDTEVTEKPKLSELSVEEQLEVWKKLSRENENRYKEAKQEVEALKPLQAKIKELEELTLSEQEKALADARSEGYKEAQAKASKEISAAALAAAMKIAGLDAEKAKYLNPEAFIDEGNVSIDAIVGFVSESFGSKQAPKNQALPGQGEGVVTTIEPGQNGLEEAKRRFGVE